MTSWERGSDGVSLDGVEEGLSIGIVLKAGQDVLFMVNTIRRHDGPDQLALCGRGSAVLLGAHSQLRMQQVEQDRAIALEDDPGANGVLVFASSSQSPSAFFRHSRQSAVSSPSFAGETR